MLVLRKTTCSSVNQNSARCKKKKKRKKLEKIGIILLILLSSSLLNEQCKTIGGAIREQFYEHILYIRPTEKWDE